MQRSLPPSPPPRAGGRGWGGATGSTSQPQRALPFSQDTSLDAVAPDRTGQCLSCSHSRTPWRYCAVNYMPNFESYTIWHRTRPLAGCSFPGCCAQVFKSEPNCISLVCLFFPPLLVVNHLAPAKPFLKYTLLLARLQ